MTDHDARSPDATPPLDPFAPTPAQPLSRRERNAILARIEALMEYWGITVADLEADEATPPLPVPTAPPPVKYRHPVSGQTWDGVGPHPEWLRHALLKEGLRVDELRPEAQADDAPDAS